MFDAQFISFQERQFTSRAQFPGCHFLGLGVVFLVVDEVFGSVLVGSQLEDVLTAVMAAFKRTD